MMDLLIRDDLRQLMSSEGIKNRLSLFMPTHRALKYNHQDQVRYRNHLRKAEQLLIEQGMRRPEAENFLRHARGFLHDNMFWQHLSDGLAVFVSDAALSYYRLPLHFEDSVTLGDHFHIRPLLPLFMTEGRFYVLALAQGLVRLFQGNRYAINEVDIRSMPRSIAEVLRYEEYPGTLQHHALARRGAQGGTGTYHTQADIDEYAKEEIGRFCHQIDRGLHRYLKDEKAHLILAGVEYLIPIYRDANTFPYLVDEYIRGNPERMNIQELHTRAWEIVKPYFLQARKEAFARYLQISGEGSRRYASSDCAEIVRASAAGRVGTLFIPMGVPQHWGRYNPCTRDVVLRERRGPDDEDLLDFAAMHTILHDGAVYVMEQGKLPVDVSLAAIFRY